MLLFKIIAILVLCANKRLIGPYQVNAFDILPFEKEFTIRGNFIKHIETDIKEIPDKLSWVESYTLQRQIAKIDYYSTSNLPVRIDRTLFKDRSGPMVFNKNNLNCTIEIDLLNGILLDAIQLNNKTHDNWFIGPSARVLLSFLQETEGKILNYIESKESFQATTNYSGTRVKYDVYYRKLPQGGNYRDELPLRMVIEVFDTPKLAKKKLKFTIDLARPRVISEDESGWDRFSINPDERLFMGGTEQCYSHRNKRVLNQDIYKKNQFSFKYQAKLDGAQNDIYEGQVDYDGRLGMMQTKLRNTRMKIIEQRLFNFKTNRRYYMTKGVDFNANNDDSADDDGAYFKTDKYFNEMEEILIMQTVGGKRTDKAANTYLANLSLGQLLFSADNLIELGLVRIEGIRSRAYSLKYSGYMPFWLDQPNALVDANNFDDTRGFNEILMSIKVFISESQSDQGEENKEPQLGSVPLRLVINTNKCEYQIKFFDFVWSTNDAENSDKFSLAKLMPGPYKQSLGAFQTIMYEYKIDLNMLLIAKEFKDNDLVNSAIDRDIALVSAFQRELQWPVQFISEFETKILAQNEDNSNRKIRKMVGTLLLKHPNRQLAIELKYIGPATKFNLNIAGNQVIKEIRSLDLCIAIASSRSMIKSVLVGFDWVHQECLICGPKQVGGSTEEAANKAGFYIDPRGWIQVYQARKQIDTDAMQIDTQLNTDNRYKLVNYYMKVDGLVAGANDLSVKIKNIEVDYLEDDNFDGGDDDDYDEDEPTIVADYFRGIGLVDNTDLTWKIEPRHVNNSATSWINQETNDASYNENLAMSLELCQSIALSYDYIESYSLCAKPGDIRCLVSKLNFRDFKLGEKLQKIRRNATIKAGTFEIDMPSVDGKSIIKTKLEKHGNCELHNKKYIRAFKLESNGLIQITKNDLVYPIKLSNNNDDNNKILFGEGFEVCARYCLKHNINFMRKDALEIKKAMADPGDSSSQWSFYKDRSDNICKDFTYFEYFKTDPTTKESSKGIYCMIQGPKLELNDHSEISPPIYLDDLEDTIPAFNYKLKSEIFFDGREGSRLKESQIPENVQTVRDKLINSEQKGAKQTITNDELNLLKKFIQDGGNLQFFQRFKTISDCALACFSQSEKLWPGCRSFGVLAWPADRHVDCYLNTATMRESILRPGPNSPAVINMTNAVHGRRMYHFEPRAGFLIDDLNAFEQAAMSTNATDFNNNNSKNHVTFLGSFIIILIVIVALALGLLLGVKVANIAIIRQDSNPFSRFVHEDIENLVPTPRLQDNNFHDDSVEQDDG